MICASLEGIKASNVSSTELDNLLRGVRWCVEIEGKVGEGFKG
jgi:hypothetical protein